MCLADSLSNEYIRDKRYVNLYTLSVSCSCLWKFWRKGMWLKRWGWLTLTEFGKLEVACSTFKVKSIFAFHFWETEVLKCNIVTLKKERKKIRRNNEMLLCKFCCGIVSSVSINFLLWNKKSKNQSNMYLECM